MSSADQFAFARQLCPHTIGCTCISFVARLFVWCNAKADLPVCLKYFVTCEPPEWHIEFPPTKVPFLEYDHRSKIRANVKLPPSLPVILVLLCSQSA